MEDKFRTARNTVWTSILMEEWDAGNQRLDEAGISGLQRPNFAINHKVRNRYGCWDPNRRIIEVRESLFLDYPRGALVEVLLHEMAHQVISEHFQDSSDQTAHGEDWQTTARILGCSPTASSCDEILREHETPEASKILERIRKLLDHGNCDTVTEEESEAFLAKARHLMLQHNLEMIDVNSEAGAGKVFVQRPVGLLFKRLPSYYHTLGNLLSNHYFVNYIQTYTEVRTEEGSSWHTRIELFGETSNVDAAEYVCNQLIEQAESLWKRRRKELANPEKRSFFMGLFDGFSRRLEQQSREDEEDLSPEKRELILREAAYREEQYLGTYPNARTTRRTTQYDGASHAAGVSASDDVRIRPGVSAKGSPKRLE